MMEWFLSLALIIVPRGLLARNGDNKNASCELDYKQTRESFAFEFGAGKCGKTLTQPKQKHFFNHCDCFHNFNYVILDQIVRQNVMSLISTIIFTTQLYFILWSLDVSDPGVSEIIKYYYHQKLHQYGCFYVFQYSKNVCWLPAW